MGYCYGWGLGGFTGGSYWWIGPVIFWGLLIIGGIYLIRSFRRRDDREALSLLKREYALGRISQEEFLSRKQDLSR